MKMTLDYWRWRYTMPLLPRENAYLLKFWSLKDENKNIFPSPNMFEYLFMACSYFFQFRYWFSLCISLDILYQNLFYITLLLLITVWNNSICLDIVLSYHNPMIFYFHFTVVLWKLTILYGINLNQLIKWCIADIIRWMTCKCIVLFMFMWIFLQ